MVKDLGVWIDHKNAVIVNGRDEGGEIIKLESKMEKHVRYKEGARPKTAYGSQHYPAEDTQDRKYIEHLNKYYDQVIALIRDANSILILGPGEAKFELEKRLGHEELHKHVVGVETADKMTDRQLAAKVRKYYQRQ
jgi:rhamnogalacturonyl hydrolase YesR